MAVGGIDDQLVMVMARLGSPFYKRQGVWKALGTHRVPLREAGTTALGQGNGVLTLPRWHSDQGHPGGTSMPAQCELHEMGSGQWLQGSPRTGP